MHQGLDSASQREGLLPSCASAKNAGSFRRGHPRYADLPFPQRPLTVPDLRSILKLQPTNTEAIQELLSLLPPSSSASSPTSSTFASATSSSSHAAVAEPSHVAAATATAELHERLGIGKPKQPKPLPFARTRLDDRRLKVVLVPAPAADGLCHHHQHTHQHTCDGRHHHGHRPDKGKGKGTSAAAAGMGTATRREKEQALEAEMLKVLEAMRVDSMSVTLPSWDRYVVRRVDS